MNFLKFKKVRIVPLNDIISSHEWNIETPSKKLINNEIKKTRRKSKMKFTYTHNTHIHKYIQHFHIIRRILN